MARFATALALAAFAALAPAQAVAAPPPPRDLNRPLDLPELGPGEPCAVSPVDEGVDWEAVNAFGSGTGPGPVYPGLNDDGHLATNDWNTEGPWTGTKVFWYAKPEYRGPAIVRGRRIDGPGSLRFAAGRHRLSRDLRIGRRDTVTWDGQPPGSRGLPSYVFIRSTGCYAVQIDGTRFSRTVIFTASLP